MQSVREQVVPAARKLSFAELFANWREVILGCNLSQGRVMDGVSKWLILVRACVFSMTLTSGIIGGLLAATAAQPNWLYFGLALAGILVAHAANNLINDYFDLAIGSDAAEDYARAKYAPHPILSGLITRRQMLGAILLLNGIDAAIMVYLAVMRGWLVVGFALAGLFISFFYVAPPLRLKRIGLGELGVTLVWGPLMIGGTYFVTAGEIPSWVWVASLPYAFLVASVLIGKHIDKRPQDAPAGTHTLPVILGEKASLRLNQIVFVLFYVVVIGLVAAGSLSVWLLVTLLSVPLLVETLRLYSMPKPSEPPDNYPVWPLWFVSIAFRFTRQAGFLFILGLLLNLIIPLKLPPLIG
jgi:1,4-dihydroxy-2-naphthoate octaprenyltransferase